MSTGTSLWIRVFRTIGPRRWLHSVASASCLWGASVFAAPPARPAAPPPRPPILPPGSISAPRIAIGLADPPTIRDYRWLVTAIDPVDEAAAAGVESRVKAIVADLASMHERRIAPLLIQSEVAAEGGGPQRSMEAARAFAKLVDDRNRAMADWESRERELVGRLCEELALDDAARARVNRQAQLEARRRLATSVLCELAPAGVELEELLRPVLRQDDAVQRPDELASALTAHADQLASLHGQRVRAAFRAMADDTLDFAEHVDPQRIEPDFIERRRTRNATRVRMERLVIDANSQSAARIADCLAPAPAAAFLAAFRSTSYPQVHPSPFELQPIVAELSTSPAIDDRKRAELLPVVDALRQQAVAINEQMERACIDVWSEWALTHTSPAGMTMQQRIANALAPMDAKRRELAAQAIALLRVEKVIDGLPTALALEPKVAEAVGEPGKTP